MPERHRRDPVNGRWFNKCWLFLKMLIKIITHPWQFLFLNLQRLLKNMISRLIQGKSPKYIHYQDFLFSIYCSQLLWFVKYIISTILHNIAVNIILHQPKTLLYLIVTLSFVKTEFQVKKFLPSAIKFSVITFLSEF